MNSEELEFDDIIESDIPELASIYVETFNSPPWNDEWTIETASKRLGQMIHCEGFYGLKVYKDTILCGLILGNEEQYFRNNFIYIKGRWDRRFLSQERF